jgi:DNA-binding SARP family transcriptional activator
MIELRSLGTAEITTDSARLTPSQEIVFAVALYLVLERGKRISRTHIATLIWPHSGEQQRAHRFRQTLLQLKKLGFHMQVDRDTVHLGLGDARSDSDALIGSPKIRSVRDQSVEFLPGYNPRFSASFREWLDSKRGEFQSAAISLLVEELAAARRQADWESVEKIAAKCSLLDAFNEEAVLAKAEAAAMRGSKRKAVSILDDYISEIGDGKPDLQLPATVLRRRVVERIPDRPALLNPDPALVGREAEMATLSRALERARTGRGSAVLLVGEAGIGKSRLSAELARFAELRGARVHGTSCRRTDVDRPLSLFVDIVPQLREMPGALGCAPETLSWLRRLTDFEQRSEDSAHAVDAEMLFENVRAALFDLLEAIAEECCLVIIIEDLQWLDKASANFLVRVIEWCETRRVLVVLNTRPNGSALLEYAETVRLETIELRPLDRLPAAALLKSVALRPGDEPEPSFVDWCLAIADGNPFFLQELAHHWIETGHRYEAPPSVNKVLQERLSRLSPEGLQVLQTCAVLNDYATMNRVERVLEYHSHQLLAAFDELTRAAMLQVPAENSESTHDQIQPRHDFLASAALSRLSPISLAFLHRRSADVLEIDLAQESVSATLLWACAAHRLQAGDRARALSLSLSCAEHLLTLGLAHDACAAFRRTVDYCVTDAERLNVLSRLATAFELAGEWAQSIDALRDCMSLAAKSDQSRNKHNEYELLMLDARHRSALDFVALLEESLQCVNCEEASPRHRVGAAVLAMKLSIDFGRQDYVNSIYRHVSPFLGTPGVGALDSLQIQTVYRTIRGDGLVPISDIRQLASVARETDGELGYSRALLLGATHCRLSARYKEGLDFVSEALEHSAANRFHTRRKEIITSSIMLHIAAGEFDKANDALTSISDFACTSDSEKERNEIRAHITRVALEQGDLPRAREAFRQIDTVSPNFSASRRGYYLALELRIRLEEGASSETIQRLVTGLEATHLQMRTLGSQDFEAYSLFLGLCRLNNRDRANSLLREYVLYRRARWPLPQAILNALAAVPETPLLPTEARTPSSDFQEAAVQRPEPCRQCYESSHLTQFDLRK